jgi:hypothetical protein
MTKCDIVVLIAASVLVIVGNALMWRAAGATFSATLASAYQYQTMVFVYALAAAWLNHLLASKPPASRAVPRILFYGFLYYASVLSVQNWQSVDDNRHYYDTDNGLYAAKSNTERALGGQILAYAGLFVALFNVHGKFSFKLSFGTFLFFAAVALNVIGSVILWNVASTQLSPPTGIVPDRYDAFLVAVSQWMTLLILAGTVLFEHDEGAGAAVFGIGLFGVWYLSNGFALKAANGSDSSEVDKAWAGSLFCWFSSWAALLSARSAVAAKSESA